LREKRLELEGFFKKAVVANLPAFASIFTASALRFGNWPRFFGKFASDFLVLMLI
jgi:hypothetical protein